MRIDASAMNHLHERAAQSGKSIVFRLLDCGMLLESLGLACYIAWSFTFWNGSLLFGDLCSSVPTDGAQIIQGALTAFTALLLALSARRRVPLRHRKVLLGVFAATSSLAVVVAAFAGFGQAPMSWMLVGFALSGLGSALRLGWEERLSVQGVRRTALCGGIAYLFGFVLFVIISLLPSLLALMVTVLLPLGTFILLLVVGRDEVVPTVVPSLNLKALLSGIPWKLIISIALAYFSYGSTRAMGVVGGLAAAESVHSAMAGIPALASVAAIALAYCFYRKNALLAFYLAFPLMAVASLLPVSLDPFSGATTF
ncbi:MAG: LuxR family transcriptional regulator, partial [Gordonibacter sp.]